MPSVDQEVGRLIGIVEEHGKQLGEINSKLDALVIDRAERRGSFRVIVAVSGLVGATAAFVSDIVTRWVGQP